MKDHAATIDIDFERMDPKALCEGIIAGCDGFRVTGKHANPNNPYHAGSRESMSYYIGYIKSLSILDTKINEHASNG